MPVVRFLSTFHIHNDAGFQGAEGETREVSDEMAAGLVRFHLAEIIDAGEDRIATKPEEAVDTETQVIESESDEEPSRPYGNAPKSKWVDWAVHCGADREDAESKTKAVLMSEYGERL